MTRDAPGISRARAPGDSRRLPAAPGDSRLVSPLRACDVVARGEDLAVTKVRAAAGDGGDGDDERGALCGPQVALPVRVDDNLDETTLCLGTARESDVQLTPPRIDGHLDLAPRAVPGDELQPRLISAHLGSPRRISAHLGSSREMGRRAAAAPRSGPARRRPLPCPSASTSRTGRRPRPPTCRLCAWRCDEGRTNQSHEQLPLPRGMV